MTVVSRTSFFTALSKLGQSAWLSIDTETTGLRWFEGHRIFSIIVTDRDDEYYFNFLNAPDIDANYILDETYVKLFQTFLANEKISWYLHNAKFDMHFLEVWGLLLAGDVHCCMVGARLIENSFFGKLSLNNCVRMIPSEERVTGVATVKDDAVENYIKKFKLKTTIKVPGKSTSIVDKHYDTVPFSIMAPYGCRDGRLTFLLGEWQRKRIDELSSNLHPWQPKLKDVYETEKKVTKVCQKMEHYGARIDREYCQKAFDFELGRANDFAGQFTLETGEALVDSAKALSPIFAKYGEYPPLTEKGNPSFTDDVLSELKNPAAQILRDYRSAIKKVSTYYSSLLFYAKDGIIHTDLKQAGTVTGRFSASNPNLQNIPKRGEDGSEYPVRRAFVPRDGQYLVSIDYSQMEYRMLIDLAGETELARAIKEDGVDVHEGTAKMMNATRDQAKTINFMLLYGGGVPKLAESLGISTYEARLLRERYFRNLANITRFKNKIIDTIEKRRSPPNDFIFSWCGRQYRFPDVRFAYKGPNHYIQGGCADVMKRAMVEVDKFLTDKKSKMLLTVHDELILEMPSEELKFIPDIQNLMVKAYPHKILPMATEAAISDKSWHDMEDFKGV